VSAKKLSSAVTEAFVAVYERGYEAARANARVAGLARDCGSESLTDAYDQAWEEYYARAVEGRLRPPLVSGGFIEEGLLVGLLVRRTESRLIDRWRKLQREPLEVDRNWQCDASAADLPGPSDSVEAAARVCAGNMRLLAIAEDETPNGGKVLVLHEAGYSHKEIALILGMPSANASSTALCRVRARLHSALGESDE
jgi:hypothetical protein